MLQRFKSITEFFDEAHPLWSEGFRPFFLLLPLYAVISIIPWGLVWGGVLHIPIDGQLLCWHIYEMIFGLGMAGILGFLLTAIPAFIEGTTRIKGHKLALLMLIWLLGRFSFWFYGITGLWINFILNVGLSLTILVLLAKPIWYQTDKRQLGLWCCVLLLCALQTMFFISQSNTALTLLPKIFSTIKPIQWLYAAINAIMILIILVLRRVSMGVTNNLLNKYKLNERFISRPPMFNLAIASIGLFLFVEIFAPNQPVLGWLAWAVVCSLLNLLNDFFKLPIKILFWHHIRYLILIICLMALGYTAIGYDYLNPNINVLNHLRHILTTGVMGLSYIMILSIVVVRHTGRNLKQTLSIDVMVSLMLLSVVLRLMIIGYPQYSAKLYMYSALVWAMAFALFLGQYAFYTLRKNVETELDITD